MAFGLDGTVTGSIVHREVTSWVHNLFTFFPFVKEERRGSHGKLLGNVLQKGSQWGGKYAMSKDNGRRKTFLKQKEGGNANLHARKVRKGSLSNKTMGPNKTNKDHVKKSKPDGNNICHLQQLDRAPSPNQSSPLPSMIPAS